MPKPSKSIGEAFKQQIPVVLTKPRSSRLVADVFMKRGDAQKVLDLMVKMGMIEITYYDEKSSTEA